MSFSGQTNSIRNLDEWCAYFKLFVILFAKYTRNRPYFIGLQVVVIIIPSNISSGTTKACR